MRWWNVKHPDAYAARLDSGGSPAYAREVLTPEQRRTERVLLELRLREGLPVDVLTPREQLRIPDLIARSLAEVDRDRLILTVQGRLLADGVVRDLLDFRAR